jgi:L-lactate dehydrogenase complex protein LldF
LSSLGSREHGVPLPGHGAIGGTGGRVIHPPRPRPDSAVTPTLHNAAANWGRGRERAKGLTDWEAARARATAVREDAVRNMPELLDRLEERVGAAGGTVHRAATAEEARATVLRLCAERGLRRAAKAKSMLTEELGINAALEAAGIESVETDLGEWIVQLMGDRPSHILAPAVHLTAEQIAALFSERSGEAFDAADTSRLVGYARRALRESFLRADVGITGVNVAVAETGTLLLVESEGNIRMCTSLPRVHIALMGIEKVVRDWDGAAEILNILPLASHGRPAPAYTSMITGVGDPDGPEELHLILVDDGRSDLRGTELESVLNCIRCGACLYACPVYRQTGGHAYGAAYSGPIGAVLTPALEGARPGTGGLPWMSSLCGACTEACPVGIPLDQHLVTLRAWTRERNPKRAEAVFWRLWARLWSTPAGYRAGPKALSPLWRAMGGRWIGRAPFPLSGWTQERDARLPPAEPFHERWKRARG